MGDAVSGVGGPAEGGSFYWFDDLEVQRRSKDLTEERHEMMRATYRHWGRVVVHYDRAEGLSLEDGPDVDGAPRYETKWWRCTGAFVAARGASVLYQVGWELSDGTRRAAIRLWPRFEIEWKESEAVEKLIAERRFDELWPFFDLARLLGSTATFPYCRRWVEGISTDLGLATFRLQPSALPQVPEKAAVVW